jgi:NAD(P)-dependent dehydrogenase (short-subunit alcohol dehydrogenase family)
MDGKRVLFLGGASGIGAATIRLFAERGASIVFGDIQTDRGEALAGEIRDAGGKISFQRADATREDDVAQLTSAAVAELGGLDVFVSIAGIASAEPVGHAGRDVGPGHDRQRQVVASSVRSTRFPPAPPVAA